MIPVPEFIDGFTEIEKENKEEEKMVKTLDIEGMMCAHCQAHVQKALEGVEGVTQVAVSLEENNAVVSMEAEVEDKKLIDAVEAGGYKEENLAAYGKFLHLIAWGDM